ncbi:deoxyribonuclease TATDN1 [Episyrphus balteatus]|uniref:deoxyribonuclease TATDN1 n=1 Tax=Episyrphus balteatus TaxID=286459 RepID=UPI002485981F|nr:deoxyribonuclease TATDN1 [Episyrphus balteatus]
MKKIFNLFKMQRKFIDIGANLTDSMFQGIYGNSKKHEADLDIVLKRSWEQGLDKIIITVGTLNEADAALQLAQKDDRLFTTIGCHPTRCNEFVSNPEEYYNNLCTKIKENSSKVIAVGECGLDYDRLHFCEKDIQKQYFEKQLSIAENYKLPLFLHCRNSFDDFMEIIERNKYKVLPNGGVVHSFDGTIEEAKRIIEFGLFIGLNGCSLKTAENLKTIKEIPNDKIMIETDSPWCGIRPSHAGYKLVKTNFPVVKKKEKWTPSTLIDSRNEPCQIIQVMEIIAATKGESLEELSNIFYDNTMKLFFKKDQ